MVHIYCGDGKGKTTAAMGLALRCAGSGRRALVLQFLKDGSSSELAPLSRTEGAEVVPQTRAFGFTWTLSPEEREEAGIYYSGLLEKTWEKAAAGGYGLLVLDEALGACAAGLIDEGRLLALLDSAPEGLEVVLTGRGPSQALLDACDQLGVYVIDEFFDCWRVGKNRNDYHLWFEDWWQRDIESTIRRDRNHPCVYCWSFGNEIPEANGAANAEYWMQAQADFIRSLDSTRLVTCGGMFMPECLKANPEPSGPPTKPDPYCSDEEHARRFKAMISHLDIVSLNYSFRHYEQFHKLFPDMPLQGTETMGSETWGNWDAIRDNDYVIGDFMWTAIDNLGEAGAGRFFYDPNEMGPSLMGGWPWLSCYQGDLALDAERLPRSYYRKVIWGMDDGIYAFTTPPAYTGKPLYGTGWHWHNVLPSWTYGEEYVGKPIQVEAYCDCDEVEFFVNGESQGKAAPVEMIATLTVTYQPGQLKAVAYRQGKPVGESVLETTGPAVALRLEADRQSLSADTLDLCYVTAPLVEEQGRRVYNDDRELSAFLRGPGTLAGFGSNNPCTEESYGTGRRFTWHGHAMLVLRAGDAPGQLELTVSTQGLETQMFQIPTV